MNSIDKILQSLYVEIRDEDFTSQQDIDLLVKKLNFFVDMVKKKGVVVDIFNYYESQENEKDC